MAIVYLFKISGLFFCKGSPRLWFSPFLPYDCSSDYPTEVILYRTFCNYFPISRRNLCLIFMKLFCPYVRPHHSVSHQRPKPADISSNTIQDSSSRIPEKHKDGPVVREAESPVGSIVSSPSCEMYWIDCTTTKHKA